MPITTTAVLEGRLLLSRAAGCRRYKWQQGRTVSAAMREVISEGGTVILEEPPVMPICMCNKAKVNPAQSVLVKPYFLVKEVFSQNQHIFHR